MNGARVMRVCCALLMAAVMAQRVGAQAPRRSPAGERGEVSRQLAVAMRLVAERRYDEAIELLRPIAEQDREQRPAAEQLAFCYIRSGRPEEAVALLEDRLSTDPAHFPYARLLGLAYLDLGRREEAVRTWNSFLGDDPKRAGFYDVVARIEKEAGLYEEAIATYRAGRKHEDLYRRFTVEIIRLERLLGRPDAAFAEAAGLVARSPEIEQEGIELALEIFVEQGRDERMLDRALASAETGDGRGGIAVLQTVMLFEAGRYAEAGELLDRLGESHEREVFAVVENLMRFRRRSAAADPALMRAFEAFLSRHGDSPIAPGVMLALAEELREKAHDAPDGERLYARALDLAAQIGRHRWGGFYVEMAALLEAGILLDDLHAPAEALAAIDRAPFREGSRKRDAEKLAMRAVIASGRWDEAERRFERLIGAADSVQSAMGAYAMGMLRYRKGEYGAALDSLSRFAERYPWSEFANDALETAMLLKGALSERSSALDSYRAATLLRERGEWEAAADTLEGLRRRNPASMLVPHALLTEARIEAERGDTLAAEALLEEIADRFPLHELAPRALETMARLAEAERPELAAKRYEMIIERYPDDPFVGRVRSRYIALRTRMEDDAGAE